MNHQKTDNRIENLMIMTAHDHGIEHTKIGTIIKNQYGVFAVLSEEEKSKKRRAAMARWRAANVAHIRAYKDRRKAEGKPY